ncbi:MAG: hypothetical protein QNJ03_08255 [Dinoroseobacter sp.]|nr:hypothetical protein [Dinoroseobacter sp.]
MDPFFKAADRVTPALARAGRQSSKALRVRFSQSPDRALLISDENFLGSMYANVRGRRLYEDAGRRLVRLQPAVARDCRRIGLAIRSYDRHWASSLAFVLRKERRGTNPTELAALAAQPRRWRDVIADVAAVFPRAEIVVWPFESLVGAPGAVLRRMIPELTTVPLSPRAGHHHPSPSCSELRATIPMVRARRSIRGEGSWSPFDADTSAYLRAEYADDIAWLRAGADGVASYFETQEIKSPEVIAGHPGLTRGTDHDQRQRRVG